jgi:hypothetical protein
MRPPHAHAQPLSLPAGSSSGAIKMWSYGSPAFTDSSAPRLLRQLKKVDPRSGVGGNPHSKVCSIFCCACVYNRVSLNTNTSHVAVGAQSHRNTHC